MRQQPFASPEEALKHHGKKGMKWGVRNEEDTSGKDAATRNDTEKQKLAKNLGEKKKTSEHDGLSSNQKKAILAAGVGAVAIGGFVAYKHYAGGSAPKVGDLTNLGNPFPKHPDMSGLRTGPLSKNPLGAMGKQGPRALLRQESLMLDTSRGYADFRPIGGFANAAVAERHASTIRALEAMREKYPAIRNMNIEVAPLSHGHREMSSALGMVSQLGDGEARLYYNDVKGALDITPEARAFISGLGDPDQLGSHEMGHILAGAHGDLISTVARDKMNRMARKTFTDHHLIDDVHQVEDRFHSDLFKKHGLSFEELSKLSEYASTSPVEALAELSANYHSPRLNAQMDPELRRRAEAMFNEMGGVT